MEYQPSSVILNDGEPQRNFFSSNIRDTEKDAYDYRTVFFDAVHLEDDRVIRLFAPPMLNFLENPGPPEFFLGSVKCRSSRHLMALKRFEEWRVYIPDKLRNIESIRVSFPSGLSRVIKVNSPVVFPRNRRILTAIQKDNRLRWISDWYRYYKEEFGVEHLVLYDNGSKYQEELDGLLSDDSITIVRWNFPYGPSISHDNKFTQIGALNHCRRVFGRESWIFSFDVDELLNDLYGHVRRHLHHRSVHYFSSYFVPFVKDLPEDYSFSSFPKRRADVLLTGKKYIYRANRSTGVLPHYVHSHQVRVLDDITVLLKKAINRTRWRNGQQDNLPVKLFNLLLRLFVIGKRQRDYPPEEAYFLHFKGITTNWKQRGNRFSPETQKPLVVDDLLKELSRRDIDKD